MPNHSLWWVPLASGFQDGINPCLLMTTAIVLIGLKWFKRTGLNKFLILFFFIPLVVCMLIINCSFLDQFILNKKFFEMARNIYVLLAVLTAYFGFKNFHQWLMLVKGKDLQEEESKVNVSPLLLVIIFIFSACFLSLLASLWPMNYYISVMSVYMFVPGETLPTVLTILLYTLISLWILYFVYWFESIRNKNIRLYKILCSAILISATIGVVDLFL